MEIGSVTRYSARGRVNFKAFGEQLRALGYIQFPFRTFGIRNIYLSPGILPKDTSKEDIMIRMTKLVADLSEERTSTYNFSHILRRNGCAGFSINIYEGEGTKEMVIVKAGDAFSDEFSTPHTGFGSSSLSNRHSLVIPRKKTD